MEKGKETTGKYWGRSKSQQKQRFFCHPDFGQHAGEGPGSASSQTKGTTLFHREIVVPPGCAATLSRNVWWKTLQGKRKLAGGTKSEVSILVRTACPAEVETTFDLCAKSSNQHDWICCKFHAISRFFASQKLVFDFSMKQIYNISSPQWWKKRIHNWI